MVESSPGIEKRYTHTNPKLQHAWNFYGEANFTFELIEKIKPESKLLLEREQHYLDLLKPYEREIGYNICPTSSGGDNFTHHPNRKAFVKKMEKINSGEGNGMFGKKHKKSSIKKQKEKAAGRYTVEWFVKRHGPDVGKIKFEERRKMLMKRKINYITDPTASYMSFEGKKHDKNFKLKYNNTKVYFRDHWNDFVELVRSNKYSQRQLSVILEIPRQTLRVKMKSILGKIKNPAPKSGV